jgi:hypothetical protein
MIARLLCTPIRVNLLFLEANMALYLWVAWLGTGILGHALEVTIGPDAPFWLAGLFGLVVLASGLSCERKASERSRHHRGN